jgi:FtsZ-interacting cell division protein ZipA
MTTNTIVLIVVVAVVAILLIATIAWVARNKRTQHRRVEAGDIRDKDAEQSHKVGNAKRSPTRPRPRAAPPKLRPTPRQRTGLQHQAEVRRSDAVTARDEVNQEFERADTIDPDTHTNGDTPRQAPETR